MPAFDLTHEQWVPVLRADGTPDELNLRDVLCEAHTLSALRDPLPTVEFGLYRLLGALVLDIFFVEPKAPLDTKALGDLLQTGHFDPAVVDAYFARYADRFDLFHPKHPFLQTVGMNIKDSKPLAALVHSQPSGTNVNHFHHGHERDFGASPAVVARLLTTIPPFMMGVGQGNAPSINGAPPWYVLLVGATLFETLCLSTFVLLPDWMGHGVPAWRDDTPVVAERRTRTTYLEALTWRPRRIQLDPNAPGVCALTGESAQAISAMRFKAGALVDYEVLKWTDPNVAYKIIENTDKTGKVSHKVLTLRPQEDRAVWRDTGALALLEAHEYQSKDGTATLRLSRPRIVDQFAHLIQDGYIPKPEAELRLLLYGMCTDKADVAEWYRDELVLPVRLLWQSAFHQTAQREMERGDRVAELLDKAIRRCHPREARGRKTDSSNKVLTKYVAYHQRQFWAALQDDYGRLLSTLARLEPDEDEDAVRTACEQWHSRLRRVALDTMKNATDSLDTDRYALERLTRAQAGLEKDLYFLFETQEQKKARQERSQKAKPARKPASKTIAKSTAQGELTL